MTRKFKRSPVSLAILALLHEGPMHPYRMQRLIKERGKDQVINVEQRASVYQTINQLLRAGLIVQWGTTRQEGFPERTVYALTDEGHHSAVTWLREMLSTPAQEYPQFPAAISFFPLLTPEDVLRQLEIREARIGAQTTTLDQEMESYAPILPRLFLLEGEYMRQMLEAELAWVRSIITDLRGGQVTWSDEWLRQYLPPESDE